MLCKHMTHCKCPFHGHSQHTSGQWLGNQWSGCSRGAWHHRSSRHRYWKTGEIGTCMQFLFFLPWWHATLNSIIRIKEELFLCMKMLEGWHYILQDTEYIKEPLHSRSHRLWWFKVLAQLEALVSINHTGLVCQVGSVATANAIAHKIRAASLSCNSILFCLFTQMCVI